MFDDFEDMMESLRKDWRESAARQKRQLNEWERKWNELK